MICPYNKADLSKLNPEFLYKFLGNIWFTANHSLIIRLNSRQKNQYLMVKKAIEYKFGLPMPDIKSHEDKYWLLYPIDYTGHRLLKIILPYMKYKDKQKIPIEKILKKTKRDKLRIYAAGAIEKAPDHGITYRTALAQHMQLTPVVIVNPCDFTYNKNYNSTSDYKSKHRLLDTYKFTQQIIKGDITAVHDSDVVAVNLDPYIGYGTTSEATIARYLGIPVYGIIAEGFDISNLNTWLLGCIDRFFTSFNQFREFVLQCDNI